MAARASLNTKTRKEERERNQGTTGNRPNTKTTKAAPKQAQQPNKTSPSKPRWVIVKANCPDPTRENYGKQENVSSTAPNGHWPRECAEGANNQVRAKAGKTEHKCPANGSDKEIRLKRAYATLASWQACVM